MRAVVHWLYPFGETVMQLIHVNQLLLEKNNLNQVIKKKKRR